MRLVQLPQGAGGSEGEKLSYGQSSSRLHPEQVRPVSCLWLLLSELCAKENVTSRRNVTFFFFFFGMSRFEGGFAEVGQKICPASRCLIPVLLLLVSRKKCSRGRGCEAGGRGEG